MKGIRNLTNLELRQAIAIEGLRWRSVQTDANGRLVGEPDGILTHRRIEVPDWTGKPSEARKLESCMRAMGLARTYAKNLSAHSGPNPSARQRSEAALATLRNANR